MDRKQAIRIIAGSILSTLTETERLNLLWDLVGCDQETPGLQRLPPSSREAVRSGVIESDVTNAIYDEVLIERMTSKFDGVRNEYLTERVYEISRELDEVKGDVEVLLPCPCCGYRCQHTSAEYDICPTCFWEDTGVWDAATRDSANKLSLAEARRNFELYGWCREADSKYVDRDGPKKYYRNER